MTFWESLFKGMNFMIVIKRSIVLTWLHRFYLETYFNGTTTHGIVVVEVMVDEGDGDIDYDDEKRWWLAVTEMKMEWEIEMMIVEKKWGWVKIIEMAMAMMMMVRIESLKVTKMKRTHLLSSYLQRDGENTQYLGLGFWRRKKHRERERERKMESERSYLSKIRIW